MMILVDDRKRKSIAIEAADGGFSTVNCRRNENTKQYDCTVTNVKGSLNTIAFIEKARGVDILYDALFPTAQVSFAPGSFTAFIADGTACKIGPAETITCSKP